MGFHRIWCPDKLASGKWLLIVSCCLSSVTSDYWGVGSGMPTLPETQIYSRLSSTLRSFVIIIFTGCVSCLRSKTSEVTHPAHSHSFHHPYAPPDDSFPRRPPRVRQGERRKSMPSLSAWSKHLIVDPRTLTFTPSSLALCHKTDCRPSFIEPATHHPPSSSNPNRRLLRLDSRLSSQRCLQLVLPDEMTYN
jgi:hypothetical protein